MACWNEPTPLKTILVANSGIYVQTSLFFLFIFLFLAKKKKTTSTTPFSYWLQFGPSTTPFSYWLQFGPGTLLFQRSRLSRASFEIIKV